MKKYAKCEVDGKTEFLETVETSFFSKLFGR